MLTITNIKPYNVSNAGRWNVWAASDRAAHLSFTGRFLKLFSNDITFPVLASIRYITIRVRPIFSPWKIYIPGAFSI